VVVAVPRQGRVVVAAVAVAVVGFWLVEQAQLGRVTTVARHPAPILSQQAAVAAAVRERLAQMGQVAPQATVATGSSRPLRRERTRITVAVAGAVDQSAVAQVVKEVGRQAGPPPEILWQAQMVLAAVAVAGTAPPPIPAKAAPAS